MAFKHFSAFPVSNKPSCHGNFLCDHLFTYYMNQQKRLDLTCLLEILVCHFPSLLFGVKVESPYTLWLISYQCVLLEPLQT